MIDQARHIVPGLRSIEVVLDEATEEMPPGVVLWTTVTTSAREATRRIEPGSTGWPQRSRPTSARTSRCCRSITKMDGRALLQVARELAAGSSEAHWRSSVGRAYYALLHEVLGTLRRWGFSLPPRDKVHTFARLKLVYSTDPDLKRIGLTLEALGRLRNAADYQLSLSGPFVSARIAVQALADAEAAIALLDALEADSARRAAAVGSIPRKNANKGAQNNSLPNLAS